MGGRIVQQHPQLLEIGRVERGPFVDWRTPFSNSLKNAGDFRIHQFEEPFPAVLSILKMMSQRILFVFTSVSESLQGDDTVTNHST